ncbi:MAG: apolipoprotein N-acyltransferase [Spirochaetaceae bacterium]|nr:MAG: apolipoprotein N-acyltransferase [Spirochaetaceae bacterium]
MPVKNRRLLMVLATALVYSLAVPNEFFTVGNPLLALIGLAGYFAALAAAPSNREARRLGALFGAVSTILSNYWLMFFGDFSVWTLGGASLGYAIYHTLLGPILRRTWENPPAWRAVAIAVVWTGYEYFKSIGFLAYPWGLIAYPAAIVPVLIQHVDITGVWALSFVFATVNAVFAERMLPILASPQRLAEIGSAGMGHVEIPSEFSPGSRWWPIRQLGWIAAIVVLMLGYGAVRLATPIPEIARVRLVLVQQNVNAWQRGREEDALRAAQRLSLDGVAASPEPVDLVVWSETSLRRPFPEYIGFYATTPPEQPLTRFLEEIGVPLLTGAPFLADADSWEIYNAAILIGTDGQLKQHYGKQHLVPFAESIPFWNVPGVRAFFQEVIGLYGVWSVGPEYRLFEITPYGSRADESGPVPSEPIQIGAPICFEDAFAYLVRGFVLSGADLLINLTDNSWSNTNSAQFQHFVAAQFRPVEVRRTLVRSTNSGLTAVLDAHGRVIAELPMFEQGTLTVDVPVYREEHLTFYTRFGDYLPQLFLLIWLAMVGYQARRDGYLPVLRRDEKKPR